MSKVRTINKTILSAHKVEETDWILITQKTFWAGPGKKVTGVTSDTVVFVIDNDWH